MGRKDFSSPIYMASASAENRGTIAASSASTLSWILGTGYNHLWPQGTDEASTGESGEFQPGQTEAEKILEKKGQLPSSDREIGP